MGSKNSKKTDESAIDPAIAMKPKNKNKNDPNDGVMRMPDDWQTYGMGPEDPLYRTWWYFVKATDKQTGAAVDTVARGYGNLSQTSMYFSDGDNQYFDRMPRRSAKVPKIVFMEELTVTATAASAVSMADTNSGMQTAISQNSSSSSQQTEADVLYALNGGSNDASGSLTIDPVTPVPRGPYESLPFVPIPMIAVSVSGNGSTNATATATAAASKPGAKHMLRKALATVDGAGSTSAKFSVSYVITKGTAVNTMVLTHPSGVVYHFTTKN